MTDRKRISGTIDTLILYLMEIKSKYGDLKLKKCVDITTPEVFIDQDNRFFHVGKDFVEIGGFAIKRDMINPAHIVKCVDIQRY